jgi:DNA-binding CsgD family transcriptional regulator
MTLEEQELIGWVRDLNRSYEELFEFEHLPLTVRLDMTRAREENLRRKKLILSAKIRRLEEIVIARLGGLGHSGRSEELVRALDELDSQRLRRAAPEARPANRQPAVVNHKKQESLCTDVGVTETKSAFASVCDSEGEPVQEAVRQPRPSQAPLARTQNAKRVRKQDLSRYLDAAKLTDKQYKCASLRWEYGLSVSEIARQLGLHRKTVDQHIESAKTKMRSWGQYEKIKERLSQKQPGE